VTNIDTAEQLSDGVLALAFDTGTNTAALSFPGFPAGLPDGNNHLTVAPGYRDAFGNVSTAALDFDFFAFAGDANHDRDINFSDLVIVAQNYGQSGRTFSQGDFNYDGEVNFSDLVILARSYNTSLPAARAAAGLARPGGLFAKSDQSLADDVLA